MTAPGAAVMLLLLWVLHPSPAVAQATRDCTRVADATRREDCEARSRAQAACSDLPANQRARCIEANHVAPPRSCATLTGRLRTDCELYREAHAGCARDGQLTRSCIDARWEPKVLVEPLNPLDCPTAVGELAARCAARSRALAACERLPEAERAACRTAYTLAIDLRDCAPLPAGRGRCALGNRALDDCRGMTGRTLANCIGDAIAARDRPAVACRERSPSAVQAYCADHDVALDACLPTYADAAGYRACVDSRVPAARTAAARVAADIEQRGATVDLLRKLGPVR